MAGNRKVQIASLQTEIANTSSELADVQSKIAELLALQDALQGRKQKMHHQLKQLMTDEERNVTETVWDSDDFKWSANIKSTLKKKFKIDEFRPLQRETINVTLSNHDCVLIMPTGGGKSLCFQLPAIVLDGFTLVISPLVSLMEDQIIALKNLDIKAVALSSSVPPKEITSIMNELISKECPYKLVYVTPERIAKSKRFMAKLEKAYAMGNVNRIVIDEVHCASHWGHDFRPDYKILGILKRQFPKLPILGLTATASQKVLDDVKDILNLDNSCVVFRASFNRPNLFYEVHHTSLTSASLISEIATTINTRFKSKSGIVYCFSKKDCEDVADGLVKLGISAHCYHADIEPHLKSKVHQRWTLGQLKVVVATIAFGMGINKSDVRFVIHFSMSKSMENYYQESGRAGRDDEQAGCILYFRFADIFRQSAMVFTEKTGLKKLYNMIQYCTDIKTCRRIQIGKHFAESWNAENCKMMCDHCQKSNDIQSINVNEQTKEIISIIKKAKDQGERITPLKLVELWMGKGLKRMRPTQITSHTREECELIVARLLLEQIVTEDYHFTPYNTITYIVEGRRSNGASLIVDLWKKESNSSSKKRIRNDICEEEGLKKKKSNAPIEVSDSDD